MDLDINVPIDCKAAITCLGGSEDLFYMMLSRFESMTLE